MGGGCCVQLCNGDEAGLARLDFWHACRCAPLPTPPIPLQAPTRATPFLNTLPLSLRVGVCVCVCVCVLLVVLAGDYTGETTTSVCVCSLSAPHNFADCSEASGSSPPSVCVCPPKPAMRTAPPPPGAWTPETPTRGRDLTPVSLPAGK